MSKLIPPVGEHDHIQGNNKALVTLVEYGDYECPYCGHAYPIIKMLKQLEKDKIKFVYRHFPLSQIHPHAQQAAFAAESASQQGKFWDMHDILFENQHALEDRDLLAYAEELHLDLEQFFKDMDSQEVTQKVRGDFMSGIRSGVNGTPTFFINGVRYDGSYELEYLQAAIEIASDNTHRKGMFL